MGINTLRVQEHIVCLVNLVIININLGHQAQENDKMIEQQYYMQNLDSIINEIKLDYKELRECEQQPIRMTIIWTIKDKCEIALEMIDNESPFANLVNKRKQVETIKEKVKVLEQEIKKEEIQNPKIGNGGRKIKCETQQPTVEASQRIIKTIVMQEIKTMNLKFDTKEIQQIMKQMQDNVEVNQQVHEMITKQGYDLEAVEKNIEETYKNMNEVNQELDEAKEQQVYHINKVRGFVQKSAHGLWSFIFKPFKYVFHDAWVRKSNPE